MLATASFLNEQKYNLFGDKQIYLKKYSIMKQVSRITIGLFSFSNSLLSLSLIV